MCKMEGRATKAVIYDLMGRRHWLKQLSSPAIQQCTLISTVVLQNKGHWFGIFFLHFVIRLLLYARMIHSVLLIRVLIQAVASSHIFKCHFCLPFSWVAVVFINELFMGKTLWSNQIHVLYLHILCLSWTMSKISRFPGEIFSPKTKVWLNLNHWWLLMWILALTFRQ